MYIPGKPDVLLQAIGKRKVRLGFYELTLI